MITFKKDTSLTIVTEFDEEAGNIVAEEVDTFKAGELVDAEIINDDGGNYVDLQFGDGTVALTVQRDCFDVV